MKLKKFQNLFHYREGWRVDRRLKTLEYLTSTHVSPDQSVRNRSRLTANELTVRYVSR